MAQTKVSGTVLSADDNQPVIGATVKVPGSSQGVVTDIKGNFSIVLPNGAKQLQFSYVGMVSRTMTAKNGMKVHLTPDNEVLDEVMVVAFGKAKKSAFTGSAKVVGADDLKLSQVSSVTDALAGAVAGVQLTQSNGAPGSSATIRIRGFSSINAGKDPLIVVDGAPFEGDMATLNPNDIESMTVLKDAASNALYGARGSNGVIMITTKRAKSGDAVITFDAKIGANSRAIQQYDVVTSPAQYYEMHYGALYDYYVANGMDANAAWQKANANLFGDEGNGGLGYNVYSIPEGQMLIGSNGKLNPNATLGNLVNYNGEDYLVTPDDWQKVGTRTGLRQEYNFSASAATDRSNFYASLGYLNEQGTTVGSDLSRLTARLRGDYQLKKWLKVGANMSYSRFNSNLLDNNGSETSSGNIWAFTSQMAPIYPAYIRNADGSVKVDANGIQMMDYHNGTNAGMGGGYISDANPIQDAKLNTYNNEGHQFTANGFADFNIMNGLVFTANASMSNYESRYNLVYNPYYGQFDTTGGTVEVEHQRQYNYNMQQLLNYTTTIAQHNNLNVMVGHEYTKNQYYALYASKSQMFSQDNKELNGAVKDGQSSGSYKTTYNNEGWIARAQYDYDSRIFASASIRRDASSRFAPENRWGTFWSAGAAWILSKESWFKSSWVDMLKVKASIGSQGNDNIGSYLYTDTYNISNSSGKVGVAFSQKGNEDITWEKKINTNAGVEFDLFKRISGSIEYFYAKTSDMLFSFSVAPTAGYTSIYRNVGDLYNSGLEFDFNVNIFKTKNFAWDVNLNGTWLKNRVTKLDDGVKTNTYADMDGKEYNGYTYGSFFITEDASIYTWRLKEWAGVDPETGEGLWYKRETDADGNYTGKNVTTNSWNDADYYVTKKSTVPPFYGGFGTKVNAYGFDFAINFTYQLGGYGYDGTYATFMSSPTSSMSGFNFHADLLKSWTSENTSSNIPRFRFNDIYSSAASTRFLTKASFLNIQNVNLGYTLPASLTKAIDIASLRLYVAAENLYFWSKRKGFDPRQTYTDTSNATRYSPMRTISGGITVTF